MNSKASGTLFNDLGPSYTLWFIVLPVAILITWLYSIGVYKIQKDLKNQVKLIGVIRVLEIRKLSEADKKDLFGMVDHKIHFEKNPFQITSTHFLAMRQPELMKAKQYHVEVTKVAKIELKREIISEMGMVVPIAVI
jgi:hypothetical protein